MRPDDPRSVWTPSPDSIGHEGSPIPADRIFFAPPPPEIGKVVSAWSTLRTGVRQRSVPACLLWAASFAGALLLAAELFLVPAVSAHRAEGVRWFANAIAAAVGVLVYVLAARFTRRCNYVGEDGFADFELRGADSTPARTFTMRFDQATELRTSQTNHFHNGAYTGTSYEYTWTSPAGVVQRLTGRYHSRKGTPKVDDRFHFVRGAGVAWDVHLGKRLQAELEANGSILFPVNRSDSVRVGQGWMEFRFGGKEAQRLTQADIAAVTIAKGTCTVRTHEARWFSSKGRFRFPCAAMSNASSFLRALDVLMGYRFE